VDFSVKEKLFAVLDLIPIEIFLLIIFSANILDATLTIAWIDAGIAVEANPIMEYFLKYGRDYFYLGKIGLVAIACLILWKFRKNKLSRLVSIFGCTVYSILIIFHVVGAQRMGFSFL
jgi:hypothetical protein